MQFMMEVLRVYWWQHDSKLGKHSSAQMHNSVKVIAKNNPIKDVEDIDFEETPFDDVNEDIYEG